MITTTWVMTDAVNDNGRKKISWQNLAPTVIAGILVSLAIGVFAFYRTVDKSLFTISDVQAKQIEQAKIDYIEKKEMKEAIFKLTVLAEKLVVQNENQDAMIRDLKESLKDKSFKNKVE